MIEVKQIAKPRNSGCGGASTGGGSGGSIGKMTDEAKHAAKADLAIHAEQAGYSEKSGQSARAAYADKAGDLAEGSPVYEKFLSRQHDDEAAGKITFKEIITFVKGLVFGKDGKGIDGKGNASLGDVSGDAFTAGSVSSKGYTGEDILADRGFRMWEDADGKSHVMTDYFSARVKAFFASLEIRRIEHSAGNRIESPAGNTIAMVAGYTHAAGGYRKAEQGETVAFHRCYFMAEDKEKGVTNDWRAGDQAFCQTFNLRQFRSDGTAYGVTNKRYWRLVISTGYSGSVPQPCGGMCVEGF